MAVAEDVLPSSYLLVHRPYRGWGSVLSTVRQRQRGR